MTSRCGFTFPNLESLFKRYLKLLLEHGLYGYFNH